MTETQLSQLALSIWRAGVDAVDSHRLVRDHLSVDGERLRIGEHYWQLADIRRIVVIGAGKAGAKMAAGLLESLAEIANPKQLTGWVNVPDDCVVELPGLVIHGSRPAGENLPTDRVVAGTQKILDLVAGCEPNDLCIGLFSGGGSALLALPAPPVTLAEKIAMTRFLSQQRANINELNSLRKKISQVKGGRLAQACRGTMINLILSDVIGDPLDMIASGPTSPDTTTPAEAMNILQRFDPAQKHIAASIHAKIESLAHSPSEGRRHDNAIDFSRIHNWIIGNNQTAVDGAAAAARARGLRLRVDYATQLEGLAEDVGRICAIELANRSTEWDCWISGGEPVVQLRSAEERGRGGRNQQLVLAATEHLLAQNIATLPTSWCLLSAGTDGEDGPTDAAGAWIDSDRLQRIVAQGIDPSPYLARNDAYHFFENVESLVKSGPTHTNVCDLRVIVRR